MIMIVETLGKLLVTARSVLGKIVTLYVIDAKHVVNLKKIFDDL